MVSVIVPFFAVTLPRTLLRKLYQFFENYSEKYLFSLLFFILCSFLFWETLCSLKGMFHWIICMLLANDHHLANNELNCCVIQFLFFVLANLSSVLKLGSCRLSLLCALIKIECYLQHLFKNCFFIVVFFFFFLPNKKKR